MIIKVGCKTWSNGSQQGLRIYADPIRQLVADLVYPSHNTNHGSLQDFLDDVNAGVQPVRYSRRVFIVKRGMQFPCEATATFALLPPTSVQGYITARQGTWFHDFVSARMDTDIEVDYQPSPDVDVLLLP